MNEHKKRLAEFMVSRLSEKPDKYILLPCSGEGELAVCINERWRKVNKGNVFTVDKDKSRAEATRELGYMSIEKDFYDLVFRDKFDLIMFIPPNLRVLNQSDDSIIGMVKHCYNVFLKPGGTIAFVCPENQLNPHNSIRKQFLRWYSSHHNKKSEIIPLDIVEQYTGLKTSHFYVEVKKHAKN